MSNNLKTQKYWAEEIVRGRLIWPNEHVIRFVKRNCPTGKEKILDFGGGAGRDSVALATFGYNVTLMDYNDSGFDFARHRADLMGVEAKINYAVNKGLTVSANDNSFDAIVADGSLFYYSEKEEISLLKDLRRVLKENGLLWASWRTTDDSLCLNKESGLYVMQGSREGTNYFFCDKELVRNMYFTAGFSEISIDKSEYSEYGGESICSWWHVVAKK